MKFVMVIFAVGLISSCATRVDSSVYSSACGLYLPSYPVKGDIELVSFGNKARLQTFYDSDGDVLTNSFEKIADKTIGLINASYGSNSMRYGEKKRIDIQISYLEFYKVGSEYAINYQVYFKLNNGRPIGYSSYSLDQKYTLNNLFENAYCLMAKDFISNKSVSDFVSR